MEKRTLARREKKQVVEKKRQKKNPQRVGQGRGRTEGKGDTVEDGEA